MTVQQLSETFGFTPLSMPEPEREVHGCYIGDLLSWVMGRAKVDNAWITIMSNVNIAAVASLADTAVIILAEDVRPEQNVIDTAIQKGVNMVTSPLSAYEIAVAVHGVV